MIKVLIVLIPLILTSCGATGVKKSVIFGAYEPDKDAYISFKGIIEEDITEFNLEKIKNKNAKILATYASSVVFEQYPSGKELEIGCKNLVCLTNNVNRIVAGEYRLKSYTIADDETEYNSNKCGIIKFDIKPGEIVYLGKISGGSIITEKYSDKKINKLLMPRFSTEKVTNKDKAGIIRRVKWNYDGLDKYGKLDDQGRKAANSLDVNDVKLITPKNYDKDKELYCMGLATKKRLMKDG